MLSVWMSLVVVFHGLIWTTGVPDYELAAAVERGAARVEQRLVGEDSSDVVRKSIQLQRDTLPFWRVIRLVGDFVMAPLGLALRALAVAVAFCAVAALTGRPVRYPEAMRDCVAWQGVWVLGLAVQAVLMLVLRKPHIDTSVTLMLPPRVWGAREWVLLQQLDYFALIGWLGLGWSACVRRQANLWVALAVCCLLAVVEMNIYGSCRLLFNLGMHLTVFPE